jgi:hypothetical protein
LAAWNSAEHLLGLQIKLRLDAEDVAEHRAVADADLGRLDRIEDGGAVLHRERDDLRVVRGSDEPTHHLNAEVRARVGSAGPGTTASGRCCSATRSPRSSALDPQGVLNPGVLIGG